MLKISEHEECWWPVTIRQPRDDGSGRVTRFETKWKFRLLTRTEAQKLLPDDDDSLTDAERIGVILDRVADRVIDWDPDRQRIRVHNLALGGLVHDDQRVLVKGLAERDLLPDTVIIGLTPTSMTGRWDREGWLAASELATMLVAAL